MGGRGFVIEERAIMRESIHYINESWHLKEKYQRLWNEKVAGNEFGEIGWENDDLLLQALEVGNREELWPIDFITRAIAIFL